MYISIAKYSNTICVYLLSRIVKQYIFEEPESHAFGQNSDAVKMHKQKYVCKMIELVQLFCCLYIIEWPGELECVHE